MKIPEFTAELALDAGLSYRGELATTAADPGAIVLAKQPMVIVRRPKSPCYAICDRNGVCILICHRPAPVLN